VWLNRITKRPPLHSFNVIAIEQVLCPDHGIRISGIELQRRLAASGSKWPVIFMTASDDEMTRNEAMDAGCIAYLRKPFAQDVLLNAISKAAALPASV
jgi:FixJ family two-component response regulator